MPKITTYLDGSGDQKDGSGKCVQAHFGEKGWLKGDKESKGEMGCSGMTCDGKKKNGHADVSSRERHPPHFQEPIKQGVGGRGLDGIEATEIYCAIFVSRAHERRESGEVQ